MNITYSTKGSDDVVTVTVANCQLPAFGRWADLKITAYSLKNGTAIHFSACTLNSELHDDCDFFDATTDRRGLRLLRQTDNGLQSLSQKITFNRMSGSMLYWSELSGGGVDAGRVVARSILQRTQSVIETIRQDIRNGLSGEVKQQVLRMIHERYNKITENVVKQFLREVNWAMMLRGAGCDDDTMTTIIASLDGRNPLTWFPITFDGESRINRVASDNGVGFDRKNLADLKASGLLRTVCGNVLGDEFEQTGGITFEKNGYTFKARPGDWVDCYDPNGKHSRLCIHTLNFSCNSTDEIIFCYLNVRNKFDEYMTTAVYHGMQNGFVKPCCEKVK